MLRRCEFILSCLIALLALPRADADDLPPIVQAAPAWNHRDDLDVRPSGGTPLPQPSRPVIMSLNGAVSPAPAEPLPGVMPAPTTPPAAAPPAGPSWASDTGPWTGTLPVGATPSGFGSASPFSGDNLEEPPFINQNYDRVLDLFPDANDRRLIERVREAVTQTEVGVDVTEEEWITVRGNGKRITWGGRVETDTVNWLRDDDFGGQPNYVEFRRLRLMASGEGYGIYDYQLELEFSPELQDNRTGPVAEEDFGIEIKDAYIGLRDLPWLGYTMIGHFRTPLGLSSLTSTRFIPFMERSLPNRLLPGRELGIASFNRAPDLNLTWGYGFFFDDLDESQRSIVDDNQGSRFIGRVTFTPYYDEVSQGASLLHTGFGYSYTRPRLRDDPEGVLPPMRTVRFTGRPEIHRGSVLITTDEIDTQQFQIFNLELAWAHGPFTVQSEGTYLELDQADGGSSHVWGSYVYGSWFLTGERRPYDRNFGVFRRVTPYENFWLVPTPRGTQAGLGAWELAARWSQLNFRDITDQYLHDITVGLNWYWNPHSRVMVNWIHPITRNSPEGLSTNSDGDILAARLQIDF